LSGCGCRCSDQQRCDEIGLHAMPMAGESRKSRAQIDKIRLLID
jgi:hypothetical protein